MFFCAFPHCSNSKGKKLCLKDWGSSDSLHDPPLLLLFWGISPSDHISLACAWNSLWGASWCCWKVVKKNVLWTAFVEHDNKCGSLLLSHRFSLGFHCSGFHFHVEIIFSGNWIIYAIELKGLGSGFQFIAYSWIYFTDCYNTFSFKQNFQTFLLKGCS